MTLAFTIAHFDDLLSRCITKEAVSGARPHRKSLDEGWQQEVGSLSDILDCIEVACPE